MGSYQILTTTTTAINNSMCLIRCGLLAAYVTFYFELGKIPMETLIVKTHLERVETPVADDSKTDIQCGQQRARG